jgi:predicted O-linked N-acetylglucosamine transferase (SPINDLY family)
MYEEAVECFRTAVALDPQNLTAHGFLVHLDQFACRWQHFDADVAAFLGALERTSREMPQGQECTPFALVAIPHDPMAMRHAAQLEAARQARGVRPLPAPRWVRRAGERLRVGYLSSDFYQHATAMLIAEVFERHDRERFEVFVYSHGRDDGSPMRRRLEAAVEHWVEVGPLTPEAWDSWMRILCSVPEAVLWLLDGNEQAKANLRREAEARGVDAGRLLFAPAVPPALHQSRLPLADLMLDTWPCNAHTTASDALWAGLPLLTLSGEIFASRVAGSLLRAVGLEELVTHDPAAYEATAVALLRDPARLAALRRRLVEGRLSHPLFDSARFTADLEALYERMAARERAGLAPEHLPAA